MRLSVSKSKTFKDCNKKYDFAYNLKLPQKDMDYHIFGKMLHLCLELFYGEYINGCKDVFSDVMNRSFKAAKVAFGKQMTEDAIKEALDIMLKFMKVISKDPSSIKKAISVEKNFKVDITDNVLLNGMIDRVDLDEDGIFNVIDYKTTKNKKYLKNDFFQLQTYAYVLLRENPEIKKVRGSYILLRHNFEYISTIFELDEILKIKDQYEACAKEIEEEQLWRANPSFLCNYCSFIEVCDNGKKAVGWPLKTANGKVSW